MPYYYYRYTYYSDGTLKSQDGYNEIQGHLYIDQTLTYTYTDTLNPFYNPYVAPFMVFTTFSPFRFCQLEHLPSLESTWDYGSFFNPNDFHFKYELDSYRRLTKVTVFKYHLGAPEDFEYWAISY